MSLKMTHKCRSKPVAVLDMQNPLTKYGCVLVKLWWQRKAGVTVSCSTKTLPYVLQFEPTKVLSFMTITAMLQHTSCYMFSSSQGTTGFSTNVLYWADFGSSATCRKCYATILYNRVPTDDGPVGPETCSSWCVVTVLWL